MEKKIILGLAMTMVSLLGNAADNLPALRVEGKNLVDANGKTVVLHGVMDTPNRYFNGWRWQQWKADYSEADIQPCLEYFSKQFAAITDKEQGAYCTVFRLHMDPCWTNDPSKKAENEADISAFNMARYRLYLQKLYIPIIKDAIAHGLYVIVRPPGVCPQDISVADRYSRYLKAIWKAFAADEYIQQNSGIISIELANEPVRVHLGDGSNSDQALHNYFQPVVDEIRAQGFKGIIWVPGAGYQSQYQNYAKYPITDSEEIDWSPEDPDKASEGHYNEWGQWTQPNLGSWATASTSKWGLAWKAVHDHFGNIGMTLTHPQEYYDIDEYLKTGKVIPGFQNAKKHNLFEECCGYACMNWYKEWYMKQTDTGIEQKVNDAEVVATYYYNIAGEKVNKPQKGIYVIKQVLKGGKIHSFKVCY